MAAIDFVDDLEVPWQQGLEEVDRPAFQSLRQHSVIGVGAGLSADVPCLQGGNQHSLAYNLSSRLHLY